MGDAHYCSGPPVSEMTYTVSSGTLNPSIPHHTNKMQSGDILVPANPGPPGKWPLKCENV